MIIGCDEVGRGPLAGPVVGAAVKLDDNQEKELLSVCPNITDSKKLTAKKRDKILETLGIDVSKLVIGKKLIIDSLAIEYSVIENSHEVIDEINILQASLVSMKEASELISEKGATVLVDGNKVFDSSLEIKPVIGGDAKVTAIALASIIAKQYRDWLMGELDKKFPEYQFAKHAGYPTKAHKEAIALHGPCEIHRKSFKGVKEFLA